MVVTKPRIIKKKVNVLEQKIIDVSKNHLKVMSRNGKVYDVNVSDRVKMLLNPEINDTAIVKTFQNGWLVTDIKKKPKKPVLSDEEEKLETERQIREIEEMWGGY